MKLHIKKIEKAIGKKIDIVWSFDLGNFYPFRFFSNTSYKIFNPVDEPLYKDGIESAKDCNIIISITREILLNYNNYNVPKHFIHHGLGEDFIDAHKQIKIDNKIRFGFSGNLLRQDIDTATFLKIVQENPEIIFECWGSYQTKQTNIGGESNLATDNFITQLTSCNNAILHGPVHPSKLANEFRRMDGFIICYDILKDQSKGTNYHKVMEYLSTGKVIVSNNITTYQQIPNLLEMNDSRNDNNNLPNLFKKVAENLDYYNQQSFQQLRIEFAMSNLYSKKIKEIENILQ